MKLTSTENFIPGLVVHLHELSDVHYSIVGN